MQKAYAQLAEGQMHYRFAGDPESPTWLLLHRTAASSVMYERLMAELRGYRCVAPDTPGFGASFDVAGWPDVSTYAEWVERFLDVMAIDRCWVFGHHTGANIAVELAYRLPQRIRGLALMGLTYFTAEERAQFKPHFAEEFTPANDGSHLNANWQWAKQLAVDAAGEDCVHQEFLDTARAYRGRVQAFTAVWDQDLPARLKGLDLPLLVMSAEDEMLYQYFPRILEELPHATQSTIKTGGSFAPELAAPLLAQQLHEWASVQ